MTKKDPLLSKRTRTLREVRSGQRPSLKHALVKVLGNETLDIDAVMQRLSKRGWLPRSSTLVKARKYVGETLSKEKGLITRVGPGLYRARQAVKAHKAKPTKVTAPVTHADTAILPVELPKQFDRGLTLLSATEGKPVKVIVAEILTTALRGRINSMLDAMKIPESSVVTPAPVVKTIAPTAAKKKPAKLKNGRFAWTPEADVAFLKIVLKKPVIAKKGKKLLGEGGWPAVARELSEVVGHKLSRMAVFSHWLGLQDKPDYLKDMTARAKGEALVTNGVNGKSHVPIDQVLSAAGVETNG